MKDQRKAQEIAAERVQLLSPLLAEGVDTAKAREIRKRICETTGLSERTIRRYLAKYRENGFEGLKPKGKERRTGKTIPDSLLEQAVLLRREVPTRSIAQIIQILEWEKLAEPGELKRSTLQEKLSEKGYSARHMRMYSDSGVAARRFQRKSRNQLWHSDYPDFLVIPIFKCKMWAIFRNNHNFMFFICIKSG
jgi:transposase